MKRHFKFLIFLFFILTNCSDLRKGLGLEKDVPDEFLIKKIDPLEKPPNYDLLPPDSKSKKKKLTKIDTRKNTKSIIENALKKNGDNPSNSKDNASSSNIEEKIIKQIDKQ